MKFCVQSMINNLLRYSREWIVALVYNGRLFDNKLIATKSPNMQHCF